LCLVAGSSAKEIAEISNIAGGLVCEKPGVVSISKEELMNELRTLLPL
jgi:bifunctional ADP-heptose synthase (sugar kinase/adenylyltransferase)